MSTTWTAQNKITPKSSVTSGNSLLYKSVDVMKKTKDVVTSQLSTAEKTNLIACLATTGATHIAISVPMDIQSEMVAFGSTPSPRTMSAETQEWCDLIHAAGLKVIHRGVFCGVEAIWGAGYIDGGLQTGTASSAASDGTNTLCGRYYLYLNTNVGASHMQSGDIFSPIPEGTSHAFDGHQFWSPNTQAAYADVYAQFHTITTNYGTANGKSLLFKSFNNYSEVASGWLPSSIFSDESTAGFDYYGRYQGSTSNLVSDYMTDLNTIYNAKGQPMFWGEWGDIAGEAIPSFSDFRRWCAYLIEFYASIKREFVDTGKLIGFNYWGGWEGQNTSIVYNNGSGASSDYHLNARGQILKSFFNGTPYTYVPEFTGGTSSLDYRF